MADIIVTTPKTEMAHAAAEAASCIDDGGGEYFRRFPLKQAPTIKPGCLVYYVEDGYVRGFARVVRVERKDKAVRCETTGGWWSAGLYVFMDATSWTWIEPIPMRGFQGFRYAVAVHFPGGATIRYVGGWLAPKPPTPAKEGD